MKQGWKNLRRAGPALAVCGVLLVNGARVCRGEGDGDRRVVERYQPVYPELAKQMRVSGVIVLRVVVKADGKVGAVDVESGHPLLVRAAEDAVWRWRFATAPEASTTRVRVNFE